MARDSLPNFHKTSFEELKKTGEHAQTARLELAAMQQRFNTTVPRHELEITDLKIRIHALELEMARSKATIAGYSAGASGIVGIVVLLLQYLGKL